MPALVRQSIETPRTAPILIEESSEDEEELLAVAVPSTKKRGRRPKDVQTKRAKKNIKFFILFNLFFNDLYI